jgi:HlyD family secretion protein
MASAAQNGRKKKKRLILLGSGVVVLLFGIFGAKAALSPNRTIDPAKLAGVERGDIARSVVATGKIEPLTKVELKSKASGIVKELKADVGDRVKAGQVLVDLDKEQLEAAVREGQANLQASKAAVESAQAASQRDSKDAEGTDVPFLKTGMDRAHELFHDGLIPRSSVEDAEKAYKVALNKQQVAQANVTVGQAEVLKAKAQVAQAEAAVEQAQQNLEYSTIVSSILVLGSQATLLMTLGDTSQVYVEGNVDEADVGKVYVGQTARIVVESFKDKKFAGKVTRISPMGEEKDNVTSFAVRVSIDNPGGELRANMSANAEIILEERHGVILIPESAVLYDKDKNTSVEIPDPKGDNGKRKIPVKLGITNGVKAQIVAGLQEGQKVVLQ